MSYKVRQYLMFAGPATLLFCGVVVIPLIYGLYLTFTSWDGISTTKPFVGFANYAAAFGDGDFWVALGRTLIYSAIAVILVNVVAFLLAYMVTRGIKGQNFFRAGFFIPNLIGGIVLGYIWQFVFNKAFTAIGANLNIGFLKNSWLSTPHGAMACMIIVAVWQYAGYMMLIYVAGFMSVSKSLIEAAQIDGCTQSQATWKVKMLHGLRCQPVFDKRRTLQFVSHGSNACLPHRIHQPCVWYRSGGGIDPVHCLRDRRSHAGLHRT